MRLDLYHQLNELTQQMVPLAKREAVDALSTLQAQRVALIEQIDALSPTAESATQSAAIERLIREILAAEREILDYIEPWRDQMRTLLRLK